MIRTADELEGTVAWLEDHIRQLQAMRHAPGRSESMRASDSIESCMAAASLNALCFALGETPGPATRSPRLGRLWK